MPDSQESFLDPPRQRRPLAGDADGKPRRLTGDVFSHLPECSGEIAHLEQLGTQVPYGLPGLTKDHPNHW